MEYYTYSNGLVLPKIGYGTSDLTAPVEGLVYHAIKSGHRFIDTAQAYGSECGVGQAVKRSVEEGFVHRGDLFIETKLSPEMHGYYEALSGFERSLNELRLDYVDMFLIHWPVPRGLEKTYREKNIATWQAFESLKQKGYVRHIGVSNFLERHLLDITENCGEIPAVNQLEIHPGFQQKGLVRFCVERGIQIVAWSPLGRGVLQRETFGEMAKKYGKDTGQLALRWSIQKHYTPLTRSSNLTRISQNLSVFDFELAPEDMEKLDALNTCDQHLDIWSYRRQKMY